MGGPREIAALSNSPAYRATLPFTVLFRDNLEMKSMTCNQLGGACELVFSGDTFDELASQSQAHGKEMFGAQDGPHMVAMSAMMELMSAGEMDSWMAARKAEFEAL